MLSAYRLAAKTPFVRTLATKASGLNRATLSLNKGPIFHGSSFGAPMNATGELVFTTSLVGYPESLTDPSYTGQILCFTQPLIGNYGVPAQTKDQFGLYDYFESGKVQVAGVVVADVALEYSHWTAVESLQQWLTRENIPGITGVDTRQLVTLLREQGSTLARLSIGEEYDEVEDAGFVDPSNINLVHKVSTKEPYTIANPGAKTKIAVIDCGVKQNILRCLLERGAEVTVFPYNYPVDKVIDQYDGLFLSNGPGDPTHCTATVKVLKNIMENTPNTPIFGICLGNQLLALAAGFKTVKMPYGNRAHNIPTLNMLNGECSMTSQNHGYAVSSSNMGKEWQQWFINLNDESNEGIKHTSQPWYSVQFHPEAMSGPEDTVGLFDLFLDDSVKFKAAKA
ncbi:hypothetical protein BABINDRAFT_160219 [Babjeviella inositovora NRRL Y-12698]|uniref:Carbamoyl phosphate synthase arginine-specific small chain n=1 Tax=Babjeviella inositovora NRRL Y-12698 TaxID=984486 RepID=A0A1E3QY61_9ASCO|nr:uncharacterized protein BABINDRAFT_160219 [Babjeviella inositovora NRRL Y-12698]ODQ82007.1 hypothetical protein BABINDRAFT_160219 [Babjeviella inositovora NRRL Y-12698]